MARFFALCAVLLCGVCGTAQAAGGTLSNPDTGIAGAYSDQAVISDHSRHVLMGHAIVVTRNGDTVHALVIHQRRDGVHRLRYSEVWSDGRELPYRSSWGRGCTHGHCRDNPVGMIFLTPARFAHAQVHGLSARLVGTTGAIQITAPPELFTDAATRAAAMEIGRELD